MKKLFTWSLVLVFCASLPGFSQSSPKPPVVVELFTSEGCSSCPPADALLIDLDRNVSGETAEVIVLGEHVDYWNYIGWTDRFSSGAFSKRQEEYARQFHLASAYTPQMVIDGRKQLVGNDRSGVLRNLQTAATVEKPARVTLAWEDAAHLHVVVEGVDSAKAQVLLAITENGLSTSVRNGENGGRTLHHAGVVRQLRVLGTANTGKFESRVEVPRSNDWNPANLKAVVLVQQSGQAAILGASSIPFSR